MGKYLTGKDYPHLCEKCQKMIDSFVPHMGEIAELGPDEDFDNERACMVVYWPNVEWPEEDGDE